VNILFLVFRTVKEFFSELLKRERDLLRKEEVFVQIAKRLFYPLMLLIITLFLGAVGYYVIGRRLGSQWDFIDCILMTSITLTTVGYGDIFNAMDHKIYKIYTIVLMWVGMGVALYAVSTITAFVVEEQLGHFFRERKMKKRIANLKDHYILCGAGNVGIHVINEMVSSRKSFVVIELSEERIRRLLEDHPNILYIQADATNENALKTAGIEHAKGLIAALGSDSQNMLLTVTARYLNKDLRIVARCIEHTLAPKFKLSGADSVVSANFIGGMRIASEMLRPTVVNFLDKMLRAPDPTTRFEEVTVEQGSGLVGKSLAKARIGERTGLTVVAIKRAHSEHFYYNPKGDTELRPGDVLVVIGGVDQIQVLREIASSG